MADRMTPYGAFNFLVEFNGQAVSAGFAEVAGLAVEFELAEYREGTDPANHVRKIPGLHKTGDVTLKRGLINSQDLWDWINIVRNEGFVGKRDVSISLMDETGNNPVQKWVLRNTIPMKWGGPSLAAKSSGDVAMEELTLAAESIEFEQVA